MPEGGLKDQQLLEKTGMALLHRLISAAGGTAKLDTREIPPQFYFDFKIVDGVALFTALGKPPEPVIVRPDAKMTNRLGLKFNGR